MTTLAGNVARVEDEITSACRRANRNRDSITLVAVSKMHSASSIEEALAAGLTHLGENRVQEWQGKREQIPPASLAAADIHLIGHLQTNKSARAVELFQAIDTLDSIKLALRLNDAARAAERILPVIIEIKLSEEASKEGLAPDTPELFQLLERLPDLHSLHLRGLMTVPPYLRDANAVRPYFQRLRRLRDSLAAQHPRLSLETLSMGMSHDFAVAIEEGSTEIRVGTALFGERAKA